MCVLLATHSSERALHDPMPSNLLHGWPRATLLALLVLSFASCASLWQQRDEQAVVWDDGDPAKVEIWLRQGSTMLGQPWLFAMDVAATPILIVNETIFAGAAWGSENARVAGGPIGYLVSLLPGITCMPLDAHPSVWLHSSEPLRLSANERERLASLGPRAAVQWLAENYARQHGEQAAEKVRTWVASVGLVGARDTTPTAAVTK